MRKTDVEKRQARFDEFMRAIAQMSEKEWQTTSPRRAFLNGIGD